MFSTESDVMSMLCRGCIDTQLDALLNAQVMAVSIHVVDAVSENVPMFWVRVE